MSDNMVKKSAVTEKEFKASVNEIGSLIIGKGLSYNQTRQIFDFILERLKDVPYQSVSFSKKE